MFFQNNNVQNRFFNYMRPVKSLTNAILAGFSAKFQ